MISVSSLRERASVNPFGESVGGVSWRLGMLFGIPHGWAEAPKLFLISIF